MGHDVDGVIFIFALFFQFLLCQVPSFLDCFDRNLAGAADVIEVARQCDQDDRVFMGQAEEVEGDEEGDGEANYAYYAFHKLHILPSQFLEMDEQEKAFVIAAIKIKVENDKKEKKKAESKAKKKH